LQTLDRYLRHLSVERGLSKNTLSAYRSDLLRYTTFLEVRKTDAIGASPEQVSDFAIELVSIGLKASSNARILAAVRGFHKFLDRAILELMYSTGTRVSEVVALDLDEINDTGLLRVRGKGSKERIVPVGSFAAKSLTAYLVRTRPMLAALKGDKALFLNKQGGRLSRQSIWDIIQRSGQSCGVAVSPHSLRHSFATHLIEGGADVRVVQELLGHSSVATTQIYTLVTLDTLRQVYASAHPRARG